MLIRKNILKLLSLSLFFFPSKRYDLDLYLRGINLAAVWRWGGPGSKG